MVDGDEIEAQSGSIDSKTSNLVANTLNGAQNVLALNDSGIVLDDTLSSGMTDIVAELQLVRVGPGLGDLLPQCSLT